MRCKCVCKTWYKLTSDSEFINMHLKKALCQPLSIILEPSNALVDCRNCLSFDPRNSLFLIDKGKCSPIPVKNLILRSSYNIVGSCNGLLCIVSTDIDEPMPISIYNPITRECIKLPKISPKVFERNAGFCYGFGFDQIRKKYKVVCVYRQYKEEETWAYYSNCPCHPVVPATKGVIIKEGESSWRTIKFPYHIEFIEMRSYETVFLDGAFHWTICMKGRMSGPERILALDISTEKFHAINFPSSFELPKYLDLINFAGSLAFVETDTIGGSSRIWCIVNSKAIGRSLHLYTCKHVTEINGRIISPIKVLGMLSNGSFLYQASDFQWIKQIQLIQQSDRLGLYIPEKELSFLCKMYGAPQSFQTFFFTPTLVSPEAINFPSVGEKSQIRGRGRRWTRDERQSDRRSPIVSPSFSD
ncbi:hypothetical protein IFM89_034394 [Coptis chinensis]|uniref:F-box associated beta-propeller type 3 domain-containing protein n=1 Tax=Coptis chinensis TaxID=261450 RepID=A0A835IZ63_9MAGN|nr:hypothetical protein IFM89_034394 [Coptis chinensis]